jgi:hypothetical protein
VDAQEQDELTARLARLTENRSTPACALAHRRQDRSILLCELDQEHLGDHVSGDEGWVEQETPVLDAV